MSPDRTARFLGHQHHLRRVAERVRPGPARHRRGRLRVGSHGEAAKRPADRDRPRHPERRPQRVDLAADDGGERVDHGKPRTHAMSVVGRSRNVKRWAARAGATDRHPVSLASCTMVARATVVQDVTGLRCGVPPVQRRCPAVVAEHADGGGVERQVSTDGDAADRSSGPRRHAGSARARSAGSVRRRCGTASTTRSARAATSAGDFTAGCTVRPDGPVRPLGLDVDPGPSLVVAVVPLGELGIDRVLVKAGELRGVARAESWADRDEVERRTPQERTKVPGCLLTDRSEVELGAARCAVRTCSIRFRRGGPAKPWSRSALQCSRPRL